MSNEVAAIRDSGMLASDRPSIAVLPFSADSSAEGRYFSDGVTEDIITELSRYRQLAVVCAASSFGFEANASDLSAIARLLDVRYILRGSMRHAAARDLGSRCA